MNNRNKHKWIIFQALKIENYFENYRIITMQKFKRGSDYEYKN